MGLFPKQLKGFFILFYFDFHSLFKYETLVRSSACSFGHSDPDSSSVLLICIFFDKTVLVDILIRLTSNGKHFDIVRPSVKFRTLADTKLTLGIANIKYLTQ